MPFSKILFVITGRRHSQLDQVARRADLAIVISLPINSVRRRVTDVVCRLGLGELRALDMQQGDFIDIDAVRAAGSHLPLRENSLSMMKIVLFGDGAARMPFSLLMKRLCSMRRLTPSARIPRHCRRELCRGKVMLRM